jgi:hypothetical protein
MSVRISFQDFSDFIRFAVGHAMSWEEIPDWMNPYWQRGRQPDDDLAALHADLDAKATRAEEFIARFVAWKLKR